MTDGTDHVRQNGRRREGNRSGFSREAVRRAGHGARGGWWAKPRWAPPPLSSGGGG